MYYLVVFLKKIKRVYSKIKSLFFIYLVKTEAGEHGSNLKVNGYSRVNKNTILGNNVNFNGMHIMGGGTVRIGDNFHSGIDCMMITSIHNYDHGNAIPYDNTYIQKEIIIEDNVWLGSRVIILGAFL